MRKLIAALTIAASFAAVPAAQAADDVFLRVDGIQGDAAVQNTPGYISVGSFNWGAENKMTIGSASGGAGAGKATFKELTIEKPVDGTSPMFFQRLATGAHFKGLKLVVRKSGAPSGTPYLRYHFQTVFTSAIDVAGGSGQDASQEKITFAYGALSQEFRGQSTNGQQLAPVFTGWNAMKNSAVNGYPAFGTAAL